ncbi:MAG: hypothetical protein IPG96_08550 [Proteobacteria bacterium]|jgi:hypothetical protein|nr:hypothetical protein [Pseudomonadota bacterium]
MRCAATCSSSKRAALWALALLSLALGCRRAQPMRAEEVFVALGEAARRGDTKTVFDLLDQQSQWSLMSAFRAQQQQRDNVLAYYPPARQAGELQRTQLLVGVKDVAGYWAAYCRSSGTLGRLARLGAAPGADPKGERVAWRSGGEDVALCREGARWTYCGLREALEQLKLKATRDLETVREGVESYKGRAL